ncbi:hypothetical protein ABW03_20550 [Bacillus altitudinis]|nr:hypothetical protein ABW03_20550 [Bacillus altitudinis]
MICFVAVAIFERNVPKNEILTHLFLGEKGGDVSETANLPHHKKENREEHKGFFMKVWSRFVFEKERTAHKER